MKAMDPRPSLLLSAFPPELAGLDLDPPPGWRVACTGVGAVAAAAATARLVSALSPERVLFLGTCGAYGPDLPPGTCVWAAEAMAASLDVTEGRAYRPGLETTRWPATWTPALPFPAVKVAVPPGITRTPEGARVLGGQAGVEHLELTGVFAACHEAGVPCGAVLAVANRVGPEAPEEWKANHARVSRDLIRTLRELGTF